MSKSEFVIYLDPISGENLKWPSISTSMPNLVRGPYYDERGSYYITMVQVWPPGQEEK